MTGDRATVRPGDRGTPFVPRHLSLIALTVKELLRPGITDDYINNLAPRSESYLLLPLSLVSLMVTIHESLIAPSIFCPTSCRHNRGSRTYA